VADGGDPDRLAAVGHLIEDAIGPDPQAIQSLKFPPKLMAGERLALEQSKGILDRVDQRPAQLEEVTAGTPGEDKTGQRSAGGRPALCQVLAKLGEGDRFAALDLGKPGL
jgi:hypothetical protein